MCNNHLTLVRYGFLAAEEDALPYRPENDI